MDEICSKAIELLASRICVPIESRDSIAVVFYPLMKSRPMIARMFNAGIPFLLKSFRVLGHILFIDSKIRFVGFILDIFSYNSNKNNYLTELMLSTIVLIALICGPDFLA